MYPSLRTDGDAGEEEREGWWSCSIGRCLAREGGQVQKLRSVSLLGFGGVDGKGKEPLVSRSAERRREGDGIWWMHLGGVEGGGRKLNEEEEEEKGVLGSESSSSSW